MSRTSALNPPPCLIGRDSEAQARRGASEAAGPGEPQIVVLAGVAGSGKTFSLHQALDHCGPAPCWGNISEFANAWFGPVKDMRTMQASNCRLACAT